MITVKFDPSRINARLQGVDRAVKETVREAAQAGMQVYYDEVHTRVPVSAEAHIFTSRRSKGGAVGQKYLYYPGDLKRAIYQKYADDHSTATRAVYRLSWRKSKPGVDGVPYGYMVEYGTAKWKGKPFLRPAYEAKKQAALDAAEKVLGQKLDEVLNGL